MRIFNKEKINKVWDKFFSIIKPLSVILISAILGALLKEKIVNFKEDWLFVLYATSGLLILLCFDAQKKFIDEYISEVKKSKTYNINSWIDEPSKNNKHIESAYKTCSEKAKDAKESIVIFGPHFTSVIGTTTHDEYLADGMEVAIRKHINQEKKETFEYTRIVQLTAEALQGIKKDGSIKSSAIGNDALSNHIKNVLELYKVHKSIKVTIYGIHYIPSFPSTLVIDNRFVFFSLPTNLSSNEEKELHKIVNADTTKLRYDFVLGIEDHNGEIPREFKQIIEKFESGATIIKQIN